MCQHPRVMVHPNWTQVLCSLQPAKMPRGVPTAPSWASVAKPSHQRLTSKAAKNKVEEMPM